MEKIIKKKLREKLEQLNKEFGEERIFGVFVYGPVNYGTAIDEDDALYEAIYIPSFEEMCLNAMPITDNKFDVKIVDFRLVYNLTKEESHEITESLYTDYYLVNERYDEIFNKFFRENRERLAHISKERRIINSAKRALLYLKYYKEYKNNEFLYKGYRLYNSCISHYNGLSFEDCIKPKDELVKKLLYDLRNNDSEYKESFKQELVAIAEKGCNKILNDVVISEDAPSIEKDHEFKEAIMKTMELSVVTDSMIDIFKKDLTTKEHRCLKVLISDMGDAKSKIVNVSDLVNKSGASRPIFTKMLEKLKEYKIANVVNYGSRGTLIEMKVSHNCIL